MELGRATGTQNERATSPDTTVAFPLGAYGLIDENGNQAMQSILAFLFGQLVQLEGPTPPFKITQRG